MEMGLKTMPTPNITSGVMHFHAFEWGTRTTLSFVSLAVLYNRYFIPISIVNCEEVIEF